MNELSLAEVVAAVPGASLAGDASLPISGVTADSRCAGPGVVFVAVAGTASDGHQFVAAAAGLGAPAVFVSEDWSGELPSTTSVVRCAQTRPVPALIARVLAGCPDQKMWTVAVTGTNGKTTTVFLVQEMLNQLHGPCGLLGTIAYDDGKRQVAAPLTTPGGPVFYKKLKDMVDNSCQCVALELSSHALAQQRTAGLGLDVALITNLGRDHLDYHADMASYLAAKVKIRNLLRSGQAGVGTGRPGVFVVNVGDVQLQYLAEESDQMIRFCADPELNIAADLQVIELQLSLQGTRLKLVWRDETIALASPLVGRFNVENLTGALAVGLALGLPAHDCARALSGVQQVPGRLERFVLPGGAIAVVDYAHTHDALAAVLKTCAELTNGRVLVVFGCGGDRDRGKRELMAEVAALSSDAVWITSDNPRSEDPESICQEIWRGYDAVEKPRSQRCEIVLDRVAAIEAALADAKPGDVVVVAGKGHEDYQLVGDQVLPLDDRQVIRTWLESR